MHAARQYGKENAQPVRTCPCPASDSYPMRMLALPATPRTPRPLADGRAATGQPRVPSCPPPSPVRAQLPAPRPPCAGWAVPYTTYNVSGLTHRAHGAEVRRGQELRD
jgi:hypothetical protein